MNARALVAAVLGPHHGEDAQLGERRLPAEHRDNTRVFVLGDPVALEHLLIDDSHYLSATAVALRTHVSVPSEAAFMTDSNRTKPSALPTASSHARSGCGMSPTTLR